MKYDIADFPRKGRGVIATGFIKKGELVCAGIAIGKADERDRLSFQISDDCHMYLNEPAASFNSNCNWNLNMVDNSFGGYDFFALRDIHPKEELVTHYGMSEAYCTAVSDCYCGAKKCWGRVYGFKEAPANLQSKLYASGIAAYLQKWYLENRSCYKLLSMLNAYNK